MSAVLMLSVSGPAFGQEWVEIVSQEERFTAVFPGQPAIEHITWLSQFGAVLPARVYSVAKGQSRYSATIVDYNPVERLLVERSRACPPGANTCQGIADWGVGDRKTDIRGAISLCHLEVRGTRCEGHHAELERHRAGPGSRDAAHQQHRPVADLRVDLHAREPAASSSKRPCRGAIRRRWRSMSRSTGSTHRGRPVRYQSTYVNIPDVPKPPARGAPAPPATPVSR